MINVTMAEPDNILRPRIAVVGVGGAGGNAINNMIRSNLEGCDFVAANTDAQALAMSLAPRKLQLGVNLSRGLGAGSKPDMGRAAAEEQINDILALLEGADMLFVTAGMGGGTGTGAAPVIARAARESGILTVGVVTKPFHFEGTHRMRQAEGGIAELQQYVDTLIVIPNQNLFRIATERTTIAEAFRMADEVLHSGVRGITDLMVMPGFMNLDFADVKTVMREMGKAMMGTGEADGDNRAICAAEAAISNPLLDDISMKGARGVLINVTGGLDMTLFEMDQAANRIRDEVDPEAQIKVGSTLDENLSGRIRVSVIATGIDAALAEKEKSRAGTSTGGFVPPNRMATGYATTTAAATTAAAAQSSALAVASAQNEVRRTDATYASSPAPAMARANMPEQISRVSVPVPPRNVTLSSNVPSSANLSTSYFTMATPVATANMMKTPAASETPAADNRKTSAADSADQVQDDALETTQNQTVRDEEPSQVARDEVNEDKAVAAQSAMQAMSSLHEQDDEDDAEADMEMDEAPMREAVNAGPIVSTLGRDQSRASGHAGTTTVYAKTPASRDMRMTQLTTGTSAAPTSAPMARGAAPAASSHVNHRSQSLFQRITGFGMVRPSARDEDDFENEQQEPVAQARTNRDTGERDATDLLEIPAFLRRQTNH